MRIFLYLLGLLSATLISAQLVMGQLIIGGQAGYIKKHQHSGYLTVAVSLLYIALSILAIASKPKSPPQA